jgi:uncharacterized phiE125 gp8 family phage protein
MSGSARLVEAPTEEPITLEEARTHTRGAVDVPEHNASLTSAIRTARDHAEHYLHRALATQTRELALDGFPPCIRLPYPPVQSVTSVKYTDLNGVEQTIDAADLDIDVYSAPARIRPAYGKTWPSPRPGYNVVRVRYVCGYAQAADIPEAIRHGMRLLIAHYFENREAIVVGTISGELPLGVAPHLDPHVVHES